MTHPAPSPALYEDELSLRDLLLFLWQARWWVVSSVLLAVLFTGLYVWLQPPRYTAEAWIRWRAPQENLPAVRQGDALEEMVTSATWLRAHLGEDAARAMTQGVAFNARIPKGQPRLYLTVTANSPQTAYTWAQRWAEAIVAWLNQQDEAYLQVLREAIEQARQEYLHAQQSYLDFLTQASLPEIRAQISDLQKRLDCTIQRKNYFDYILFDLQKVRQRWEQQNTFSDADALLYLTLQQRIFSGAPCGGEGGFILQLSSFQPLENLGATEGLTNLDLLAQHVQTRLQEEKQRLPSLQQQLARLQQQLEEAQQRAEDLKRVYKAKEAQWLQRENQWREINAAIAANPMALLEVSPVPPDRPQPSRVALNVAIAGVAGAFVGLMAFGMYRTLRETPHGSGS